MDKDEAVISMANELSTTQAAAFLKDEGWDFAAIQAYRRYVSSIFRRVVAPMKPKLALELKQNCYQIGSPLYTVMYRASRLSAVDKLALILQQCTAAIDQHGFLQLGQRYSFSPTMAPHDQFLRYLRKQVQRAFPKKSLKQYATDGPHADVARKIHLFRSYIDRHNIIYIREHFAGSNDLEKLLKYGQKFHLKFDYSTGANYHNRFLSHQTWDYPKNMKIQVTKHSRMSEFIVDLVSGQFVSEWTLYQIHFNQMVDTDPMHYDLATIAAIANTASFNYGLPIGQNVTLDFLDHHSHRRLDVQHPDDPDIRRLATNSHQTTYWQYEKDYPTGRYADIVKKGIRDDLAWQKIPAHQRSEVYDDFVNYCIQRLPLRNPGFYHYDKQRHYNGTLK